MPRARRAFFLALALYALWTRVGRRAPRVVVDTRPLLQQSFGLDRSRGNIVGVQPFMTHADYASAANYFAKLDSYFQSAAASGWLNAKSVIALPEYVGTWLLLAGEKNSIASMRSTTLGMLLLIVSNPIRFLYYLLRSNCDVTAALFRMNAESMASIYHNTFSRLALKYGVTIAAGSVLLPSPSVSASGALLVTEVFAPLENVSVLYRPDGSADPRIVRKVHMTPDEAGFTRAGELPTSLPVYDTPIGRLGSLICADSWYPDVYSYLQQQRCDAIVVGAWVYPYGVMEAPWGGYVPPECHPADVPREDIGKISEGASVAPRTGTQWLSPEC